MGRPKAPLTDRDFETLGEIISAVDRREAAFPKCPCGNTAGVGETHCGVCRSKIEAASDMAARFEEIRRNARCGLHMVALLALADLVEELHNGQA